MQGAEKPRRHGAGEGQTPEPLGTPEAHPHLSIMKGKGAKLQSIMAKTDSVALLENEPADNSGVSSVIPSLHFVLTR